jgi:hypothetical protein
MQNVLAISCFLTSNICYSQTVYPNMLELSQVGYYNEYDFLEFFQFFPKSLNFEFKFQTFQKKLKKFEKILFIVISNL